MSDNAAVMPSKHLSSAALTIRCRTSGCLEKSNICPAMAAAMAVEYDVPDTGSLKGCMVMSSPSTAKLRLSGSGCGFTEAGELAMFARASVAKIPRTC